MVRPSSAVYFLYYYYYFHSLVFDPTRTILLEKQVAYSRAHSDVWTTWPQSRVADGCGTSYFWWLCFGSSSWSGGFEGNPYLHPQLKTQLDSCTSHLFSILWPWTFSTSYLTISNSITLCVTDWNYSDIELLMIKKNYLCVWSKDLILRGWWSHCWFFSAFLTLRTWSMATWCGYA